MKDRKNLPSHNDIVDTNMFTRLSAKLPSKRITLGYVCQHDVFEHSLLNLPEDMQMPPYTI